MSKQLYVEALADVKKLKEVAENNAKNAIIEAVTPRIREFIENSLQGEIDDQEDETDDITPPGMPSVNGEMLTDVDNNPNEKNDLTVSGEEQPLEQMTAPTPQSEQPLISSPDEEGKVTLDLSGLEAPPGEVDVVVPNVEDVVVDEISSDGSEEEYELSLEAISLLAPLIGKKKAANEKMFELNVYRISEAVDQYRTASKLLRETRTYQDQISKMIAAVQNMYEYLQEAGFEQSRKSFLEEKLEKLHEDVNNLKKQGKNMKKLNEAEVTLKLTGMPDDIDLEQIGVDLLTGEEEEGTEEGEPEDLDIDITSDEDEGGEEGQEGEDLDLNIDADGEDVNVKEEGEDMSDDQVIEIDESVLRRELIRARKLFESAAKAKSAKDFGGGKSDGDPLKEDEEFGGGKSEGDPLKEADGASDDEGTLVANESVCEEGDEMEEGGQKGAINDQPENRQIEEELQFESKLRSSLARRAKLIRESSVSGSRVRYNNIVKRFNESLARSKGLRAKMLKEHNSNSGSRSEESRTNRSLQTKLAETNLYNAKHHLTKKLFETRVVTSAQKAAIVRRIDAAKSVGEVRALIENFSKRLSGKTISESAVKGSASQPAKQSQPVLTEGVEVDRWGKLAGIIK